MVIQRGIHVDFLSVAFFGGFNKVFGFNMWYSLVPSIIPFSASEFHHPNEGLTWFDKV